MLLHSFVHLPGIGIKKELALWESGICSWDFFDDEQNWDNAPFSRKRCEALRRDLDLCRERLCALDAGFFGKSLAQQLLWRLFADFKDCTAFLDIETSGMGGPFDYITAIALYDGRKLFHYVHGENLDSFVRDLEKYRVLVTYNGACFDLPFIRNYFRTPVEHVHIDLRYLLASLGFRGGLKNCERSFGLDRGELDGLDGRFAVLLWREYRETGNPKALETLLAYNAADAINLQHLMVQCYNLKISQTPFNDLKLPLPCAPAPGFTPDLCLVEKLRSCFCDEDVY